MQKKLTDLEQEFFNTLDLFCRLKLGLNGECASTDEGARFINDMLDVLCNIMAGDKECFHKLCEFYKSVNASFPDGAGVTPDEALATKHVVERVFLDNMS